MLGIEDIDIAVGALKEAAAATARDFGAEDVAGEEDFSGQLIGRLKGTIDFLKTPHARWHVGAAIGPDDVPAVSTVRFSGRQMGPKGRGSEETWSGADLLLVLEIRTPNYEIRKGVLVQAKRLESGRSLPSDGVLRLKSQCRDMLDLSAASFVFLYARTDLTVISATAVEGSDRRDLHALVQFSDSTCVFLSDFLKCWIGDPRLTATDRESLAVLRALARARNALLIKAEQTSV